MSVDRIVTGAFGGIVTGEDSAIPVPVEIMTGVIPKIHDIAELQVLLAVVRMSSPSPGWERPVRLDDLRSDTALRTALKLDGSARGADAAISRGIELSLVRGSILELQATSGRRRTSWYYLHTTANRARIEAMQQGFVEPPEELWSGDAAPRITVERPSPLRLYEQNIGPLTPLVADQILRALEVYPRGWIEDAIQESVAYNRRSWRYIQRILENWRTEGRGVDGHGAKSHATHRRDHSRQPLDPNKYRGGEHLKRARDS